MSKYFHILIILFITCFSGQAVSGRIAETFGEGVFGVKWGDDIETVKRTFPNAL
jgi:hypothetical protein